MRWRRPKPKRVPGEYPERFVKAWMATTLPSATDAEAASAVAHLRGKGWTEEQVAEFILPYMPCEAGARAIRGGRRPLRSAPGGGPVARPRDAQPVAEPRRGEALAGPPGGEALGGPRGERPDALPPGVTPSWLDQHLPGMDRRQLGLVVDELERRGWPPGTVAMAVLPHLLPTLSAEDARAVVAGLAELGLTEGEIARATTPL